ncbi:hypothetical protein JOD29_000820 [Lysinibacillus composti]|uniref:XkdN-like protein n=1 Tax=Lysinibacillus composti TaxID=720633 RepID=A0A3N9UIN2_9BACI|nr:hypothetical protein [Lysinibacillus composti]MBM7607576.1 hypothetical protein [Lysinibacillus composti]RQW75919.1 hypothetical protein EBB45_04695 [Lysinibacillus composti]
MSKRLTVTDLLKEKEKYVMKDNVTEELYIERLDATITIQKPSRSLVLEAHGIEEEGGSDIFLIYNSVTEPNLKDAELQKAFDCKEPTDIVEKVFSPGEIVTIAQYGLSLAGYSDSVKRVKDLKN